VSLRAHECGQAACSAARGSTAASASFRRELYCLADRPRENTHLFGRVTRIRLAQVPAAIKCILWDTVAQRIGSVTEHQAAPRPA
jgi:hypothetical protein